MLFVSNVAIMVTNKTYMIYKQNKTKEKLFFERNFFLSLIHSFFYQAASKLETIIGHRIQLHIASDVDCCLVRKKKKEMKGEMTNISL